ncbi:MAG: hypothetical protein K2L96_08985 [Muribaculaceae bacterium]|nr:hypothetical protein [Muribaculaceae bacterium]
MKGPAAILLLFAAVFTAASQTSALVPEKPYAASADAMLDSLRRPRLFVASVEAARQEGLVMTLPTGEFLVEATVPGTDEIRFTALGCDSVVYAYSRGFLRRGELADGIPGGEWLPGAVAERVSARLSDSKSNAVDSVARDYLSVLTSMDGTPRSRTILRFDSTGCMLRSVERRVVAPDAPGLSVTYKPLAGFEVPSKIDEAWLRSRYPDAFVPRLPHTALRNVHDEGGARVDLHSQARDAVVVILDATDPSCAAVIRSARKASHGLPLFWAFRDARNDDILRVMPSPAPGETALGRAVALPYAPRTLLVLRGGEIVEQHKL